MARALRQRSTSSARARRRNTKPDSRVLLLGAARKLPRVEGVLGDLQARVERVAWERVLGEQRRAGVLAVVLVAPLSGLGLRQAVRSLISAAQGSSVPIIALANVGETDREARALYRAGATAVLHWPREAKVLSSVLAELLGISLVRGPTRRVDVALARNVRARLRLFGGTTPGLQVAVGRGVAHLRGSVPSLERKHEITRTVSGVAGIIAAETSNLRVIPRRRVSDRELLRSVQAVLRATRESDAPSVAVSVRGGHVKLTGTLRSRRELGRITAMVTRMPGVRGIESAVSFAPRRATPDPIVRARLLARLRAEFPQAELHVTVFSGRAVVSGRVKHLCTKLDAMRIVRDDEAIDRTVDKIRVA